MDTKVIVQGDIFVCEQLNNLVSTVLCEYLLYKEPMNDLNTLLIILRCNETEIMKFALEIYLVKCLKIVLVLMVVLNVII
jgi:hypothetical protein